MVSESKTNPPRRNRTRIQQKRLRTRTAETVSIPGASTTNDADRLGNRSQAHDVDAGSTRRGDLHRRLVQRMERDYGATRNGFREALIKAGCRWTELGREDFIEEVLVDALDERSLIPDAFLLEDDVRGFAGYVTAYEVEVTHPVNQERLDDYAELWFALDCHEIDLRLIRVDRFGTIIAVCLMAAWYDKLARAGGQPLDGPICAFDSDRAPCRFCGRGCVGADGLLLNPAAGWRAGGHVSVLT